MTDRITRRTALTTVVCLGFAGQAYARPLLELDRLYGPEEERSGPGVIFSDLARDHDGKRVLFRGYIAPQLIAESTFFVLADIPMSVCPFCETEAEWPNNIIAIYAKRVIDAPPFWHEVEVDGVLRLGAFDDPDTGFLSMIRLEDAVFRVV